MSATPPRAIDTVLMRGGTSRGPVVLADSLPENPAARDAAVVRLVGGGEDQTDALGGGSPTTSKVVVVKPVQDDSSELILDYAVGNIVVGRNAVDWSGTCGNMTATVALYAFEENIIPTSWEGPVRLRNSSTGGRIDTLIEGIRQHERGREAALTTRYLEPSGAVLGSMLPTGAGIDLITLGSSTYRVSVVDVTHPYLFMLHDEVVGDGDLRNPDTLQLIERIRAEVCVRLGVAASPDDAMRSSPGVPRAVLVHRREEAEDFVRISAVSMGKAISSVPVTAAMCLAAACQIPSTLLARGSAKDSIETKLTVISPGARLTAYAALASDGQISAVGVDRTARTIMRGTAWI